MKEVMMRKLDTDTKGQMLVNLNKHINGLMGQCADAVDNQEGVMDAEQAQQLVNAAYFAGNVEGRLISDRITAGDYEWLLLMSEELEEHGEVYESLFKKQECVLVAKVEMEERILLKRWQQERMYFAVSLIDYIQYLAEEAGRRYVIRKDGITIEVLNSPGTFTVELIIRMDGILEMGVVPNVYECFVLDVLKEIDHDEISWDPGTFMWSAEDLAVEAGVY